MKKTVFILFLVLTLMASFVTAEEQFDVNKLKYPPLSDLNTPKIDKITLDNGMRIYLLVDKALPLFNASVRINAGSYLESADKIGLAGICGTVMRTGGTAKWSGDEIDEMLEGIGGYVETGFDVISGSASVNMLSEFSDLGLEVLTEILRNPRFDADKIDLAKVQTRTGISRRNDDIGSIALREYRKLIYGVDSPYGRHPEYATIAAIERGDLVNFHNQYVRPENIQLAIWGDIDKETIKAKLTTLFGDWEKSETPVPPPPKVNYEWRSKVYYAEKTDAKQSYVRIGHLGGLVSDADYTDRIVMNSILGEGFGSRVMNSVRTKLGLAYSAGGRYISNFAYPGYFFTVASTKPSSTIQAAKEMIKQIKSMQTDKPTKEEMYKGKDGYLNSFVFNFDSRGEVINRMMTYDFYGLPEDFLQQEKEKVEQVTPEMVMLAAQNNLRPDNMIILVAGNEKEFDAPLTSLGLGEPEKLDISIPSGKPKKSVAIVNESSTSRAQEILNRSVEAHGGQAAFDKIESISKKATMIMVTPNGEFPIPVESIDFFPRKSYTSMNFMGKQFYQIRNGDVGWKTDQGTGEIVEMTAEDMTEGDHSRARNMVKLFKATGSPDYKAVYDSEGEVNGVAVDFILILDSNGEEICKMSFDKNTGRLVSQSYWGKTPTGEAEIEDRMIEYGEFNGVTLSTLVERWSGGKKIMAFKTDECVINAELAPGQFDKPE